MKRSLRDFRALIGLDEERHFGRAAQKVGMSQPQLSELIARVESSLGFPLFFRRPQVVPTRAGAALVDTARNVLAEVDQGIERARRLNEGSAGVVRIGFVSTVMLTDLAGGFSDYRQANPQVQLSFREGYSRELADALDGNLLDVVFTRVDWAGRGLNSVAVLNEPFVAIFAEDACDDCIPPDPSAASQPLLLFPRERAPAFYDQIVRVAANAGFVPSAIQHVEGWQSTLALVRNGFGMAIGPACLSNLRWPGLKFVDLPAEESRVPIFINWKEERASPAVLALVRSARKKIGPGQ